VIDHEIDRHERLDQLGTFLELLHRVTHGGEINQQRHSGEILQDDARDDEGNFLADRLLGVPVREGADIVLTHPLAVEITQHRLEDDANADGQLGDRGHPGLFKRRQGIVCYFLTRLGRS
jgi:hypothetical protein